MKVTKGKIVMALVQGCYSDTSLWLETFETLEAAVESNINTNLREVREKLDRDLNSEHAYQPGEPRYFFMYEMVNIDTVLIPSGEGHSWHRANYKSAEIAAAYRKAYAEKDPSIVTPDVFEPSLVPVEDEG